MRREITKRYNYLSSEINSLYHQAAKKMGISDSVQNILYVLCDQGNQALQSEICSISGISRQTINSALSKLEQQGLVRVEPDKGRNTMVFLTEQGQKFAAEKVAPLFQIENKIWSEWTIFGADAKIPRQPEKKAEGAAVTPAIEGVKKNEPGKQAKTVRERLL